MKIKYFLVTVLLLICFNSCRQSDKENDYALLSHQDDWSHHYAFGSPSWDTFERLPNNPVYTGRDGMEWPVNGYLFSDPVTKNWYLFVGEYRRNYSDIRDSTSPNWNCVIYKSNDKGKIWKKIGDLFPMNMTCYDSIHIQVADIMVVYDQGKYHMVFDWVGSKASWQDLRETGIGYAVANQPEGPYLVSKEPQIINTRYLNKPLLGRYWRVYAPMIIKRKNDWALLYLMDTSPARSWALAVSTATKPEGPYNDSKLILNVEKKTNYPPLLEYFPAFTHDEYVYFPATSVSINRNYQMVYRVKTEDITNSDKYEKFTAGSLWHSVNVENEFAGIWGQTFSGFVDDNDTIYVMFPSKNPKNYGTINLAKTSWNHLYRDRGFNLPANEGNSFSYINKVMDVEAIDMKFRLEGTLHIIWDFHSRIDILNGWGKFDLHQNDADYKEIVVNNTDWEINVLESGKNILHVDSGKIDNWNCGENRLQLTKRNGKNILVLNGVKCWEGILKSNPGVAGVSLNPHSYLFSDRLVVNGHQMKGSITYGFYEALLNAGNQDNAWDFKKDTMFLYGTGAVSKNDSSFAKWNFNGIGFKLFSPKGPAYGKINIYLDGKLLRNLTLKNPCEIKSEVIFEATDLNMGSHAVYIESLDGLLPLDCIKIEL
jgi:hypothetical protein